MANTSAQSLRVSIREQLHQFDSDQRDLLTRAAINHFMDTPEFQSAQHIALFYPVRHELSLLPLIQTCWELNKQVYLPRLLPEPAKKMIFQPYNQDTAMLPNRYAIPEPDLPEDEKIPYQELDIVVMPLLAFGQHGERLGMGGGYYDRTFAFKLAQTDAAKPMLWAIALKLQQADLIASSWDVPLQAVATESGVRYFSS